MFQFTLKDILLGTTVVVVSCVALFFATEFWAHAYFLFCLVLLLTAPLLAFSAQDERRGYWLGFAVFGWGYWFVLSSPILDLDPQSPNWTLFQQNPIGSSYVLDWLYVHALPLIHEEPVMVPLGAPVAQTPTSFPRSQDFARVGHCIFALLFAVLGGEVGRRSFVYFRGASPESEAER